MEKIPKCIGNINATLICKTQTCTEPNPFICDTPNHDCKNKHTKCLKLGWIPFKKQLDQYMENVSLTTTQCNKVNSIIKKGSQQLKEELEKFNAFEKQPVMLGKINEFYECIQVNEEEKWTGMDVRLFLNTDNQKIYKCMMELRLKMAELKILLRELYVNQLGGVSNKVIKIKFKSLLDLNKELGKIKSKPEYMELKCVRQMIIQKVKLVMIVIVQNGFDYAEVTYCDNDRWQISNIITVYQLNDYAVGILELIMQLVLFNQLCRSIIIYIITQVQQCSLFYNQVIKLLSSDEFQNLKILTIYFSQWKLQKSKTYNMICQSLSKMPKLELFTAVVSEIDSKDSFILLGDRFKALIDQRWTYDERWK